MWGIIIALVFRFIFIMIGAALVEKFVWIFFAFGVWMVYTAVKQVLDGLKEARDRASGIVEEIDYQPTAATKFISRVFPVTSGFVGDKLIHRASGKTYLTPLLICIISIGTIDLLCSRFNPSDLWFDERAVYRLCLQCVCFAGAAPAVLPCRWPA